MRVTSNNFSENLITNFHAIARRQLTLQDQIATGQRTKDASDDPFGAHQVLQLRDDMAANTQYQKNIGVHQEFATVTHGLMRNLQKVLDRAQEIATTVDDLDSPESLKDYAGEVNELGLGLGLSEFEERGEGDAAPTAVVFAPGRDTVEVAHIGNLGQRVEILPGKRGGLFHRAVERERPFADEHPEIRNRQGLGPKL